MYHRAMIDPDGYARELRTPDATAQLRRFVDEALISTHAAHSKGGELYKAYKRYADKIGWYPAYLMGPSAFGAALAQKYRKRRISSGVQYQGVIIKAEYRED